eukprot:XP_011601978.1 PREDICTED: transmembrane protein 238-like [Takifugu rubripes]
MAILVVSSYHSVNGLAYFDFQFQRMILHPAAAAHLVHLTGDLKLDAAGLRLGESGGYCQRTQIGVPHVAPDMEQDFRGLGRCTCCFWAAVAFDTVGLSVLLIGVFVTVFFYDLLIYAGAIIIFLSLIWWVFWYSGNIEVPVAELEDDVGLLKKNQRGLAGIGGAVRRFSTRLSSGIRNSFRSREKVSGHAGHPHRSAGGLPPQAEQVVVAMAVMAPQASGDTEIEMPPTTTETSPT